MSAIAIEKDCLRVTYVVHTFAMGGLERCVARLVNYLDSTYYAPSIVCLNRTGSAQQWLESRDIPIVELRNPGQTSIPALRKLAQVFRDLKTDVVHSHNWGTLVETAVARRWAGTPSHVHAERGTFLGSVENTGIKNRLRARVATWALNRADSVIAVADCVREKVENNCGRLRHPIQVIPNGIESSDVPQRDATRRAVRAELGVSEDAALIGSVGRLVRVKDFANAVTAVELAYRNGQDVHLVLVGDGPEWESLHQQIEESAIVDRVHLVGLRNDVGRWLAAMDLYINSSLSEGMSQSILEAMSCGLALVVTDVGNNAQLARGWEPCGLVVPPGDSQTMANAICEIILQKHTKEMFQNSARRVYEEHYGVDVMIRRYDQLYRSLAKAGAA